MIATSLRSPFGRHLLSFGFCCALAGTAAAQCALEAQRLTRLPDADGDVLASALWDPDGAGPLPEVVVFGGAFHALGDAAAVGLAVYDPAARTYSTLGTGIVNDTTLPPWIDAIASAPNGDLVVAGRFATIDGVAARNIALWDGTAWHPLGSGIANPIHTVSVLPNGDIVAGTTFASVLRWDGATWSPMGTNPTGVVRAFATMPNGDLVAGGHLVLGTENLARWDGTTWSTFGTGPNGDVFAIVPLPNGQLAVAGFFELAGGGAAPGVARWDGAAWSGLGTGLTIGSFARALTRLPNGDLVAGGVFTLAGGQPANQVARWNGSTWSAMGAGLGHPWPEDEPVTTLLSLANGEVVAGGKFLSADGTMDRVARWNGSAWTRLSTGTGFSVFDAIRTQGGDLVAAGDFVHIEGTDAQRIARFSGGTWQAFSAGIDDGSVRAILELPNGDLVVGGTFSSAGGVFAQCVARWDGIAWHALGGGLPGTVLDLAYDTATGQILAAGSFVDRFAVWDGEAWHGTGVPATFSFPVTGRNFATTLEGDILVSLGSTLARWNGFFWETITPPPQFPQPFSYGPIALLPNGDVAAARSQSVSIWNGTSWTNLPTPPFQIASLLALPDGGLLVGAAPPTSSQGPMPRLARWDGTTWQTMGVPGLGSITRMRWSGERVQVMGPYTHLLDTAASGFAELVSPCPAAAAAGGAGCNADVLAATSLPWIDSTYTSVATGMPAIGIVLEVYGLGGISVPLDTLLPEGLPGCVAAAAPDLLRLHLPQAGRAELELAIPNTPSFVGSVWHQQVVPFELDAQGAIVAITATNSLVLTLGAF